jgi:TRAP-type C4-dicarboxylate transport system permease large subunit
MIMLILGCASFLTAAMGFTKIPMALADWVLSLGLSKYALIGLLVVVYLILGTALDGISMIVLTTSIVLPMVERAGFDLVWFGIFMVLMIELAEITPPVGFNLFVLQNMTGRDSFYVAGASLPFFWCTVLGLALITVFPEIATWLPDLVIEKK